MKAKFYQLIGVALFVFAGLSLIGDIVNGKTLLDGGHKYLPYFTPLFLIFGGIFLIQYAGRLKEIKKGKK